MIPLTALAAAFNLVCVGTHTTGTIGTGLSLSDKKEESWRGEFRIDLAKGRWCAGSCQQSLPIESLTDTAIQLSNDKGSVENFSNINRETGRIIQRFKAGNFVSLEMGECQVAPFTGLPQPKF